MAENAMEVPFLRITGGGDLPASPAAELLAWLAAGERTLEQLRALGLPLHAALEALHAHPLGEGLEIRGQTLRWAGESDLGRFWEAADQGDLRAAWAAYRLPMPGHRSALEGWQRWLEAERERMLAALLELTLLDPPLALSLAEAELDSPTDRPKALAATLLRGEALLRRGEFKGAVHALAQALGLQEFGGETFSALSLAILAEAQAAWGHARKASETAQKALSRQPGPYAKSRAQFALWRATGNPSDLEIAKNAAQGHPHWLGFIQALS